MIRQSRWGQENPRDQLRVILGAIEMDLWNMSQGIVNERQIPRLKSMVVDAQLLAKSLPAGEWEKER